MPHWSHVAQAAVLECRFEEMHHLPYSPVISDYHLFPNVKNKHRHGQRLLTEDAANEWLKRQSELFYFTGIEKLRDHCKLH